MCIGTKECCGYSTLFPYLVALPFRAVWSKVFWTNTAILGYKVFSSDSCLPFFSKTGSGLWNLWKEMGLSLYCSFFSDRIHLPPCPVGSCSCRLNRTAPSFQSSVVSPVAPAGSWSCYPCCYSWLRHPCSFSSFGQLQWWEPHSGVANGSVLLFALAEGPQPFLICHLQDGAGSHNKSNFYPHT